MDTVADPGGAPGARPHPTPIKTSQKKMAAAPRRKFHQSSGLPFGQISGSATGTPAEIETEWGYYTLNL